MAIIDKMTADYLTSTGPDPTQASIDAVLRQATRVMVVPFANYVQGAPEQMTLLDTSKPESLASLRGCFEIVDDPETFGHCMCCGEPHIELYSGDELIAKIGYHHGSSIRWNAWRQDAWLKEPEKLLDWMSTHGVTGPRDEVERSKKRQEESRQYAARWLAAMPDCLRPFLGKMESHTLDAGFQQQLLDALRAAIPDSDSQALTLFGWFGSGAGPWRRYPSYESMAEQMLLHYPTSALLKAITDGTLTDTQWRGAARYFGGWSFSQVKAKDRNVLPASLKQRLLGIARTTEIADNIQRAERAFGV